jgi:arabinose-5-phosphate isomerase
MDNLDYQKIIKRANDVIEHEAEAIKGITKHLSTDFAQSVELISNSKGRVIVTGIGKSANIAHKMVATFNSTGTPAIYMHAADAIHGDLGMVQKDDIVICLSKSGNTPEIKVLIPLFKTWGNKIIAIVSNPESYLAQNSDYVLLAHVKSEACPNNLAPTSSSTAQLVMGDALAVCLLEQKGFTSKDFAKYHPGGSLGKKLYLKVNDIYINNEAPAVNETDSIDKVILEISGKRLGATVVLNNNKEVVGIITDGDLRRMLQKHGAKIAKLKASDIMSIKPKNISPSTMAAQAFSLMEQYNITQLAVVENGNYLGMIHLHDLLKEGFI